MHHRSQLITIGSISIIAIAIAARSAGAASIGDVFVIDMENHNLVQPNPTSSPNQLQGNLAAPFLNSLMTPGNANAVESSWASAYHSVGSSVHPSEPNYIWQEGGSNYGVISDTDPYGASNVFASQNLSGLLQSAGISWKSYQEDIDLSPNSGSVNNPGSGSLTSTVAPQSQWTVPLKSFSGTSSSYTNPYNGSHQYYFAAKHDGQLFYTATNGGTTTTGNYGTSNSERLHYQPLQQLSTDLSSSNVARYNFITPDLYNDMHTALTGGFTYHGTHYTGDQAAVAQGDNFLSQIVPMIESSAAYQDNGMIIIWFDETENGDTSSYTLPEIIISPLAKGNAYQSTASYTHSSDLLTMQEIFQVQASTASGGLGGAGNAGIHDLSNMFQSGTIPVSLSLPLGDATGDGKVNADDLAILDANMGKSVTGRYAAGDFNNDGVVNADDYALFAFGLAQYNQNQGSQVPEPASLALMSLAMLGLRRGSRQ
ncbi:MAG TPA: alkaline phosphatase family protein [Tepidisphaeraceae bacterium]|nr:alkaline phosphatase family protein [Tepidisphaeraceae bacterium]